MSWDDIPEEGSTVVRTRITGRQAVAGLALLMGIGSILMSGFLVAHFIFIVQYFVFVFDPRNPNGGSWRTMLFGVTSPWFLTGLVGWLTVAWALGYAGYRLGRARLEPDRRASIAASAVRFSTWGMVGCGLDLAILAGMLTYRLYRWYYG